MGVELIPTVAELCEVADVITVHLPKTPRRSGSSARRSCGP
jgi:phosphoglycerate dehydrogenase-like enzyme